MKQRGLSVNKLTKLREKVEKLALVGSPSSELVVDHTKALNPYKSLYGNNWRDVIKVSGIMRGLMCIKDMVKHMHDASAALMKGMEHKDNWVLYHNALSLMTANKTIT